MASKHLKKNNKAPKEPKAAEVPVEEPVGKHAAKDPDAVRNGRHVKGPETGEEEIYAKTPTAKKETKASKAQKKSRTEKPPKDAGEEKPPQKAGDKKPPKTVREKKPPEADAPPKAPAGPEPEAPPPEEEKKKPVIFRRERAKEPRPEGSFLSHRDAVSAMIALVAALVLLAATVVIWVYRDSFSPDGMILSTETAASPQDEYVFDAGSGEAFAAAGKGLAVANGSGLELLDGEGTPVTSKLMQMERPVAAGCDDYAVFYDLGGTRLAVARFDGTVQELAVRGDILSATVSETGYLAVTTEYTGYRALVTVYDPTMTPVYEWYSSSAWVISAVVSPDGRKLAVLSYTASGSEVRFFSLTREEQLAYFAVANTVMLDVHWFSSDQLCAISSEEAFFFNADGQWKNTYTFSGQYLVGYTFDGGNCAAFALSPYRAGTTATLVSLDPTGDELGTAEIHSEIVCLSASNLEIMVLCSDGAILYNSTLSEKGRLNGLPGFKYGLLRSRGEALLIASNYAEVYTF